jgi:NhaA family Na+:H+ antiporter
MLFAVACLGGIGFTMSIFVDTLSFGDYPQHAAVLRDMGKVAVLMGSLIAALLGIILVNIVRKKS